LTVVIGLGAGQPVSAHPNCSHLSGLVCMENYNSGNEAG